jgi:hypothetical protein
MLFAKRDSQKLEQSNDQTKELIQDINLFSIHFQHLTECHR